LKYKIILENFYHKNPKTPQEKRFQKILQKIGKILKNHIKNGVI